MKLRQIIEVTCKKFAFNLFVLRQATFGDNIKTGEGGVGQNSEIKIEGWVAVTQLFWPNMHTCTMTLFKALKLAIYTFNDPQRILDLIIIQSSLSGLK